MEEENQKPAEEPGEQEAPVTPAEPAPETPAEKAPEPAEDAKAAPARRSRGKETRQVTVGIVHITSTFNNTLVSISDTRGAVISWSSGGRCGFKGSRKSTAYAATMVAQEAARTAVAAGLREVSVRMQGPGAGRESAVRALQSAGLTVTAIEDVTPIPHNGCRPSKRRRV